MQKDKQIANLYRVILALKNLNEARRFFRDLLTEGELVEFSERWRVAEMLYNQIPYSSIEKETGLSSTTIARISKWLNNGKGGYKLILKRLNKHHHNSVPIGKGLC